jgi:N-acetylmuramoyl-L-alanine amidase
MGENILYWLNQTTGLPNRGMNVRPSLWVLRKTRMPAVLIELGFITNATDAALMANEPNLFATGIYNGIRAYYGLL